MPKITCKYFTTVLSITSKDEETFEISSGTTVDSFLKSLIKARMGQKRSEMITRKKVAMRNKKEVRKAKPAPGPM